MVTHETRRCVGLSSPFEVVVHVLTWFLLCRVCMVWVAAQVAPCSCSVRKDGGEMSSCSFSDFLPFALKKLYIPVHRHIVQLFYIVHILNWKIPHEPPKAYLEVSQNHVYSFWLNQPFFIDLFRISRLFWAFLEFASADSWKRRPELKKN